MTLSGSKDTGTRRKTSLRGSKEIQEGYRVFKGYPSLESCGFTEQNNKLTILVFRLVDFFCGRPDYGSGWDYLLVPPGYNGKPLDRTKGPYHAAFSVVVLASAGAWISEQRNVPRFG